MSRRKHFNHAGRWDVLVSVVAVAFFVWQISAQLPRHGNDRPEDPKQVDAVRARQTTISNQRERYANHVWLGLVGHRPSRSGGLSEFGGSLLWVPQLEDKELVPTSGLHRRGETLPGAPGSSDADTHCRAAGSAGELVASQSLCASCGWRQQVSHPPCAVFVGMGCRACLPGVASRKARGQHRGGKGCSAAQQWSRYAGIHRYSNGGPGVRECESVSHGLAGRHQAENRARQETVAEALTYGA